MDAFTRRVELEDNDEVTVMAQSPPPPASDAAAGNVDDYGAQNILDDDDQVVLGQEHLETTTRRRRPFYEGRCVRITRDHRRCLIVVIQTSFLLSPLLPF